MGQGPFNSELNGNSKFFKITTYVCVHISTYVYVYTVKPLLSEPPIYPGTSV